jgi:hypothetical protein
MRADSAALTALGLAAVRPVPVTNAVIDAIAPGPDLRVPGPPGSGNNGPTVAGHTGKIGQLYLAAGQHYVLLDSGLATVGPVMLQLMLASDSSVTSISAKDASAVRSTATPVFDPPGFPTNIPTLVFANAEPAMVCVVVDQPDPAGAVVVHAQLGPLDATDQTRALTGPDGVRLADAVLMPPGQATLVRTLPAPGDTTPNTTTYLVTDQGVRYALPRANTAAVLGSLGYAGITPVPVPRFLLALLPIGPTLDPDAARQYVGVGGATPSAPQASTSASGD